MWFLALSVLIACPRCEFGPVYSSWLAERAGTPSLVISIMTSPPPEVCLAAVAEHAAEHVVICAADDENMARTMATAMLIHGDAIANHEAR